jgi:peptide/nickel transport system substrate-binding protein
MIARFDPKSSVSAGHFVTHLCRAACIVILVVLVSCGRAPRKADLVVGVEQEPASLDPRLGSDVAADRVFRLLYRGLFRIGPDFEPVPDLVQHWRRLNPVTYRFTLKTDIRFCDGRKLTASDVAFTLESILSGDVPSYRKGDLDRIEQIRVVDPTTLEITLREPYAAFLSNLNVGIVPAGTRSGAFPPVGCGPYALRKWIHGQWLVFARNPYYRPIPRSRSIAFKIIPDPVVRALEMRRGSVDLVVNDLPPDSLNYFREKGYLLIRRPGANYAYVGLNCARPPLDRRIVRQALACAIDRRAILKNIFRGFGRPATGLLPPGHWAYDGNVRTFPYDPVRARALLDAAGLKPDADGVRFRLSYKTSNNKVSRQIASAVAEYLDQVGVKTTISWLEWGTFYSDVKRGDFDAYALNWVGITDPDAFRLRFASTCFPPEGFNRGHYSNPEVDRLVEEGAREQDTARRRAIYAKVQAVLADDVPYISLWYPDNVCMAQRGVHGIVLPPDGDFSFLVNVYRGKQSSD